MEKDVCSKAFYAVNERFADLINGVGCQGLQIVKADDLSERDTQTGVWRLSGFQRKRVASRRQKSRDLLRKVAFGFKNAIGVLAARRRRLHLRGGLTPATETVFLLAAWRGGSLHL